MTGSESTPNEAHPQPPPSQAPGATGTAASPPSGGQEQAQTSSVDNPPTAPPSATPQPSATAPSAESADDVDLPQSPLPAGYYTEDGVPTFDAVAERIQQRTATADGNQVLDGESAKGTAEANDFDQLKQAGKDRLAQLRKSMGMD